MLDAAASAAHPQPDIPSLARVHSLAAIQRLIEIMDTNTDHAAAVEAARLLLAYGHGMPVQPISIDAGGIHIELSTDAEAEEPHPHSNGESHASWNAGK